MGNVVRSKEKNIIFQSTYRGLMIQERKKKERTKQKVIASMIDNPKIFYLFLNGSLLGKDAERELRCDLSIIRAKF